MRPKIRLDPVVKLEERREEHSLRAMAEAGRKLGHAEAHVAETRARVLTDRRQPASASHWLLAELAHTRALGELQTAVAALQTAGEESEASRARYAASHARAEVVRKVADIRVGQIVRARNAAELREQDELAILRAHRNDASL